MGFDEEWERLRSAAGQAAHRPEVVDPAVEAREALLERLAEFRSRVVLVPLDVRGGLWTSELGGLDWICVFSDEEALARFAEARGEGDREWAYRRVAGARLLDELVPALDFPCGVAWNAAGPDGLAFPPVRGIVPDAAALDGEMAA
ncbi:SseB family protein [Streptomyces sp. DSM 40907]|uniref:SseB family protein n=1 Tax=Streptomyces kutzneri TaxID=3051179 RepID=UPI0028D0BC74|nr:SseB family protein [Streptomyces sp. DSM 40907]